MRGESQSEIRGLYLDLLFFEFATNVLELGFGALAVERGGAKTQVSEGCVSGPAARKPILSKEPLLRQCRRHQAWDDGSFEQGRKSVRNSHLVVDPFQALVDVVLGFGLLLLHQDGSDELVHLVLLR